MRQNDLTNIPAAACPRCGGWTTYGGCAQHAASLVPGHGRTGCVCHAPKTTPNERACHFAIGTARNILGEAIELFRTNPSAAAFMALDTAMRSYQDSVGLRRLLSTTSAETLGAYVDAATLGHDKAARLVRDLRNDRAPSCSGDNTPDRVGNCGAHGDTVCPANRAHPVDVMTVCGHGSLFSCPRCNPLA